MPVVGGRPKSLTEQGIEHVNGLQDEVGGENRRSVRCIYRTCGKTSYQITLFGGCTQAGFPSPADDYIEGKLDLNAYLVRHPSATFFVRVAGDSMIEAGIHDGDFVFVRKQATAERGAIVIALVGDEATCKYFYPERDHIRLQPANSSMAPILIPKSDFRSTSILGTVVGIYRQL